MLQVLPCDDKVDVPLPSVVLRDAISVKELIQVRSFFHVKALLYVCPNGQNICCRYVSWAMSTHTLPGRVHLPTCSACVVSATTLSLQGCADSSGHTNNTEGGSLPELFYELLRPPSQTGGD